MGRLVDADKIIELMIKDRDYAGENGFMDMFYERQHLIGVINEQPTAYDVDAVVEQLNNEFMVVKTDDELMWNIAIDKAIEIVEGGGRFNG